MSSKEVRETRLVVTARQRRISRLDDWMPDPCPPDPTIEVLQSCSREAVGTPWLTGGEPTLREDLPALIQAVAQGELGLCTDALALADSDAVVPLRRAGLTHVRVTLHSARPDAHDWLVRQPGAGRRALKALRACATEGLAVELAATVTRPTAPYLAELCELAAHLRARAVHLRQLRARGPVADAFAGLAPQQRLLEPHLEDAARAAARLGVTLRLHGFTRCAAPRLEALRVRPADVQRLLPRDPEWLGIAETFAERQPSVRCPTCPGSPVCPGAAPDYVHAFGWQEYVDEPTRPLDAVRITFGAPPTVACPDCANGGIRDEPEATRAIRQRLITVAGVDTQVLRVASASSLAHPQAAALLAETRFLRFRRVEVAAEGSALDQMADEQLSALGHLARLDVALYGPDAARHDVHVGRSGAWAAALRGLARLSELTDVPCGAFAVLHDATELRDYARAWEHGALPGTPTFRLSARGGSLDELAAQASQLQPGRARSALAALLPPCLLARDVDLTPPDSPGVAVSRGLDPAQPPCGSDRLGAFLPCVCDDREHVSCPGLAVGWTSRVANPDRCAAGAST